MNRTISAWRGVFASVIVIISLSVRQAAAVEALLLQDSYVDYENPTTTYGDSGDLRVSKNKFGSIRAFLKFSTATLPPGTVASDIKQARLRLWVNSSTEPCGSCIAGVDVPPAVGSITLIPVTSEWSESSLNEANIANLNFGLPQHEGVMITGIGSFVGIDVTDWVQAWLDETLTNEGGTEGVSLRISAN